MATNIVNLWRFSGRSSIPKGCGHLFPSGANAESAADVIEAYVHEPERYLSLRAHVEKQSHTFTWDAAVSKPTAIWAGSASIYLLMQTIEAWLFRALLFGLPAFIILRAIAHKTASTMQPNRRHA